MAPPPILFKWGGGGISEIESINVLYMWPALSNESRNIIPTRRHPKKDAGRPPKLLPIRV